MSNIKINKIEAKTTNLAVTPNGTGVLEVSGDNDGALKLKDSQNANGVEIQAPPSSAAQDYTLILPDTDLVQDRYLQVDSITGSGSTAVGQLRSATITPPDLTQLNASNFTSGTVPSSRYSVTGSAGGGYKLIQKQEVTTAGGISSISFTGLDANAQYLLLGEDVHYTSSTTVNIDLLNASNSALGNLDHNRIYDDNMYVSSTGGHSYIYVYSGTTGNHYSFHMEFCTGNPNSSSQESQRAWYQIRLMHRDGHMRRVKIYGSFDFNYDTSASTSRIYGVKVYGGNNLNVGTKLLLYKYQET
tara:strand:+ start:2059 stop:2961 length:903 start_codon:yes stop_codon:yes gene_type:complete